MNPGGNWSLCTDKTFEKSNKEINQSCYYEQKYTHKELSIK